jgi:hypothetical protein
MSRSSPPVALSSRIALAVGAIGLTCAIGCGGSSEAAATERLWVSAVPTSPKANLTAFLTTRTSDGKYIGAFFKGSLYRGGHDVFQWNAQSKNAATVKFLQDGQTARLRFESCKPSRGFDYCLVVHGDPTGAGRYQSRKRWAVRRPGKKDAIASTMVLDAMTELAAADDELRAAFLPGE